MAVSGTNQSKHVVSPTGSVKTLNVIPTNQTKNVGGSLVYAGQPIGLLLALTYATPFSVSGGAINQSKS